MNYIKWSYLYITLDVYAFVTISSNMCNPAIQFESQKYWPDETMIFFCHDYRLRMTVGWRGEDEEELLKLGCAVITDKHELILFEHKNNRMGH